MPNAEWRCCVALYPRTPMQVVNSDSLDLKTESDIVRARQVVRQFAQTAAFSLVDQTKVVTAASELARNTVKHGGGGVMTVDELLDGGRRGVRVKFEDQGPGIADMNLAMTDGWNSGGGLGLGLTGSKR